MKYLELMWKKYRVITLIICVNFKILTQHLFLLKYTQTTRELDQLRT